MNYGVKSISMDDIASDIGISKKTIYKHFSTKDRLINITLTHFLKKEKKTVARIHENSENAVEEIILIGRHIIKMARSLKPTLVFDLKKYHSKNWQLIEEHHTEFIKQVITDNLERGIQEGLFRSDLKPEVISRLYVAKSLLIANDTNFTVFKLGLDDLFKEHLLYHLYGVLSEEGLKLVKKYELETI
jgi:AcrR family transcriptional regulator